ncbi:MAG TPA: thioredoxin family protein [Isosphaeraceae bacterium]|jgi:tetratricopeptide (TPR) repeat protein|nr:thioredoxin family protein [Isosphaeraceae bacterium]
MRRGTWRIGILAAIALGVALPARADEKAKDRAKDKKEIAWAKSYEEAVKAARAANKPIMIDFYTVWCGPCRMLESETYTDGKVIAASEKFVSLKLDAEKEGEHLAKMLEVQAYPTILFLDPQTAGKDGGDVVGKILGFEKGGPFTEKMNTIEAAFRRFPATEQAYEKDPSDPKALARLVNAYVERGNPDAARKLLDEGEKRDPEDKQGRLARLSNAVADAYKSKGQEAIQLGDVDKGVALLDKAIALFRKAATIGKDPSDVFHARYQAALCYYGQDKYKESFKELEAAQKVEGVSADRKRKGAAMLQRLKDSLKQQGIDPEDKEGI